MNKEKTIEKAKKVAKEDYDKLMIKWGCHDPSYIRPWNYKLHDNGSESYALDGTPDKAYVFAYPKVKKVLAARPDGSIIKSFQYQ